MIKSELVQRIASQNPHLYQRDVENIVNAILGEITSAMAKGDRVELRGFGAFSVKHRPARTGRRSAPGPPAASGWRGGRGVRPWSTEWRGRIESHQLDSEALRGNPLGDAAERPNS